MKKTLLLLSLALTACLAFGADFQTDLQVGFEEEEGYVWGEIVGQNGWTGREGQHLVSYDFAYSGASSLNFNGVATGDYEAKLKFDCDDPEGLPVHVYFMYKPSEEGSLRFYVSEGDGRIITIFFSRKQFSADAPTYITYTLDPELDADTWYEVGIWLDPAEKKVTSFYIGDFDVTKTEGFDYIAAGQTGVPDSLCFYTAWTDEKTVAYVDDVVVESLPEPACIGLLALVGLVFFNRIK